MLFYVVFIYLNNKFRFPGDSCGYEDSDIANPSKRGKKIGLFKKKIRNDRYLQNTHESLKKSFYPLYLNLSFNNLLN